MAATVQPNQRQPPSKDTDKRKTSSPRPIPDRAGVPSGCKLDPQYCKESPSFSAFPFLMVDPPKSEHQERSSGLETMAGKVKNEEERTTGKTDRTRNLSQPQLRSSSAFSHRRVNELASSLPSGRGNRDMDEDLDCCCRLPPSPESPHFLSGRRSRFGHHSTFGDPFECDMKCDRSD